MGIKVNDYLRTLYFIYQNYFKTLNLRFRILFLFQPNIFFFRALCWLCYTLKSRNVGEHDQCTIWCHYLFDI